MRRSAVNRLKRILGLAALAAACVGAPAHAARVGVFIGGGPVYAAPYPYYSGGYYAPPPVPYYYAPAYYGAGYAGPSAYDEGDDEGPVQFVERDPQAPGQQSSVSAPSQQSGNGTWFYCEASKTYYPYVKQCAAGWREVPARPQQ